MDDIKIGLDFGTHQTKICICKVPDEGHGVPEYEFFKFVDLKGQEQYFIPSVIQINNDDTLSYGYVDPEDEKEGLPLPTLEVIRPVDDSHIDEDAHDLYLKYSLNDDFDSEGIGVLKDLLKRKYDVDKLRYKERKEQAQAKYEEDMKAYKRERNLFRYFKQATFAEYPWDHKIDSNLLCIWYLAYILFLLEEIYPDGFAINMGVPTDDKTFHQKRELGTVILLSAIHLVEDVYEKDLMKFLNEKVDNLIKNTEIKDFSEDDKEFFRLSVFPEAYASLVGLTSKGKLSEGMSINADIGGGTTDITFFIVKNRMPKIYKYWSIPQGLNYIAELSGFDYSEKNFIKNAHKEIIQKFNQKKLEIIYNLERMLVEMVRERGILRSNLFRALQDRIVVYNGGGSTYPEISTPISRFTDVKVADVELWSEEIVKDKKNVGKLFNLLTTAYGLSVSENDSEVILCDFDNLLAPYSKVDSYGKNEIDKDVC